MTPDPGTDLANLKALQAGDDMALNAIITRWEHPLLSFACRYVRNPDDARDLVACVFVKLYRNRERLRPDTRLSAWLFTTLSNQCLNHIRWMRRHPTVTMDAGDDCEEDGGGGGLSEKLASPHASPGEALEQDEVAAAVREAIGALPHDLRVVILLHHYEKLSYREIAEVAGCSERGVETRLYRAKQRLRAALSGFMQEASAL